MSDTGPVQPPAPPGLDAILPLWLRDWRILLLVLVALTIGGPEVREGIRSLMGVAPAPAPAVQSCCEEMAPRIQQLEDAMRRNDESHRRIIALLSRTMPAPAGSPSPRRDETPTSARALEVPAP